jgi:hypothetical protein
MQLQLYAVALERAIGRTPDAGILYFLRSEKLIEADFSPLAIGGALEVVHQFRCAQTKMEFPLVTGHHCYSCEFYRVLCPAGNTTAVAAD